MNALQKRIPQIDGGSRELYARTEPERDEALELLRQDPAQIECITVAEYVDRDRWGAGWRYVLDGAS